MDSNLTAKATTTISATKGDVWSALTNPEEIKKYMFGTDVHSDFNVGSPITWSGEMKGKKYTDKGEILAVEPERTLAYSHYSPLSGKPDKPENYHTVTIKLGGSGDATQVTLTQDNNADANSKAESEKGWTTMLAGLKKVVESKA